MKRTVAILLLLVVAWPGSAPWAQEPDDAPPTAMSVPAILEGLQSGDPALRDRAHTELELLDAERAAQLGAEVLRSGCNEALVVLAAVGATRNQHAMAAAVIALESETEDVRLAALDAMLDAPVEVISAACDTHLKDKRRSALQQLTTSAESVAHLCDASSDNPGRCMRLLVLVDRCFGSAGFLTLLGRLADQMQGEDDARPDGAQPDAAVKAQQSRRRDTARAVFHLVWVDSPATQFSYSSDQNYADRTKAVGRIRARLKEMEQQVFEINGARFTGARCGDHMVEEMGNDEPSTAAAAVMRLRWWRGDDVPLAGEGYSEAVAAYNAMRRPEKSRLRSELKRWWESYRAKTEKK